MFVTVHIHKQFLKTIPNEVLHARLDPLSVTVLFTVLDETTAELRKPRGFPSSFLIFLVLFHAWWALYLHFERSSMRTWKYWGFSCVFYSDISLTSWKINGGIEKKIVSASQIKFLFAQKHFSNDVPPYETIKNIEWF